uniref:SPOR domain-containing protein n=1 Tax=uncultured Thiotrichaceae bacterium TaxID=298394 RepID=A0A6S6U3L2_9GAMM|nr:MAG: Unknown protein [uncultured Thiotrichaceae bacterium]
MSRQGSALPSRQRGIAFWHILLLIVIAVSLAVCAKNNSVPVLQRPLSDIKNEIASKGLTRFKFQNNVPAQRPSESHQYYNDQNTDNVEWLLTNNDTSQVKPPSHDSSYELQYPRDLSHGFYTVQVLSGYNSKNAYQLRNALRNEGYKAYIHQETTDQGILFKVRVGKYTNRADAFAMNTKLRIGYPKNIKGSFVLLRQ